MATIPAVVPRPRSRSRFWSSATSASEVSLPATEAKARSTPMTTTLLRIGAKAGAKKDRRALSRAVPSVIRP